MFANGQSAIYHCTYEHNIDGVYVAIGSCVHVKLMHTRNNLIIWWFSIHEYTVANADKHYSKLVLGDIKIYLLALVTNNLSWHTRI